MATLTHPCRCLTTLDRRDGRRCEHDSWGTRRPAPEQHWASPHRDVPLPIVLLACLAAGVLFSGLLLLGQAAVCGIHNDQHPICEGWTPTPTTETETRP